MQGMQERRGEWCVVCVCVCVSYSPPPCIYIREPRVEASTTNVGGPMGKRHMPWLRRWGPRTRSADQVGRSAYPDHQPTPTSTCGLSWASLSGPRWGWPVLICLNWVPASLLVHLSLNRCSDNFCDFMSGQNVLVTCILA